MGKLRKGFNSLISLKRRNTAMRQRWIVLSLLLIVVLVGCGGEPTTQPVPIATAPPPAEEARSSRGGDVVASGHVVPAQKAGLSFALAGRVESVPVAVGYSVQAGDPLIVLETELLTPDLQQAEAALAIAQAQLDAGLAGPNPGDIAAAEGAVTAAEGAVAAAQAVLLQAEINAELSVETAQAALDQAQGSLDAANANLEAAEAYLLAASEQRNLVAGGASEPEIAAAQAALAWAEMSWKQTRDAHDNAMTCFTLPSGEQICPGLGTFEEQARDALAASELALAAAQAQLDYLLAMPEANALDVASANVAVAEAQRDAALAQVTIAEATLAQAQALSGTAQRQAALAEAAVSAAQAGVQVAQGQLSQAQAQRDRLVAGPTAREIAQLEAGVAQAQAALTKVEGLLADATLLAPFDGTVASLMINPGESVLPGQVVLTLADLDHLLVETTDLSERDVEQVAVGQGAAVYVEALNQEVEGEVIIIQPQSSTIGGDVVYQVTVQLNELPEGIRWGMSVEVEFSTR
jgi:HlyD family secretion protein